MGNTAAQAPATARALMKQAGLLYKKGKAAAIQRQYGQALRSYQRALRAVKRAQALAGVTPKLRHVETTMLYIIARTFAYRSQWCSARKFYRRCMRRLPRPILAAKANTALQSLRPRVRFSVQLKASPLGATFAIRSLTDPGPWRQIPADATIGCGSFQVEARLTGHTSVRKSLDTFGTPPQTLSFVLQPNAGVGNPGKLVQPGKPPARRNWPRVIAWGGVATAALTGVIGVVMVGLARSEFAGVDAKVGDPLESIDQIQAQRDRGVGLQNAGFVFWGLAAAAGGVAVWGFLSQPKKPMTKQNPDALARQP